MGKPWRIVYDHKAQLIYVGLDDKIDGGTVRLDQVLDWAFTVPKQDFLYSDSWGHVEVPNGNFPGDPDVTLRAVVTVVQFGGPMPKPEQRDAWKDWWELKQIEKEALQIEITHMNEDHEDETETPEWLGMLWKSLGVVI